MSAPPAGPAPPHPGVHPVWVRPSPRMLRARATQLVLLAVPCVLGAGVAAGVGDGALWGLLAAVLVLAAALLAGRVVYARYRSWGYLERDEDLLVRRGVLVRRLSVVPYGRMQFVDVTAGPVDRKFGLATVHLHTAAAHTDARIPGLVQEEADRLRDRLAALGEAQAAGL